MFRDALRRLRRSPGYVAVVVATLGVGIGSSAALYSIVDSVLVEPLPYPDSDRLVRLVETVAPEESFTATALTYSTFAVDLLPDLNLRIRGLSDVGGYASTEMTVTGMDQSFRLVGARVSSEIFPLLQTAPSLGRPLEPDDRDAVVLSSDVWRSRFGRREDVLGRSLTLDGQIFTVVGVMPVGFAFPDADADFWIPLHPGGKFEDAQGIIRANNPNASVIARLAPGVSEDAAGVEAGLVLGELRRQSGSIGRPAENVRIRVVRLSDELLEPIRPVLLVLAAAVGFVLLIACANVTGLGLARAASRGQETAIRLALGGGRKAVLAPDLVESVTLGLGGGAAGIMLAYGAVHGVRALGVWSLPRAGDIALEGAALGFTLILSILTGLGVGLAPAFSTWKGGANALIQEGAGAASSGSLSLLQRYRARAALVLTQIVMTMVLLVNAGLLIRSFVSLVRVDPGYDAENLLAFQVALPDRMATMSYGTERSYTVATTQEGARFPLEFAEEFLSHMDTTPDIGSAALMWGLPTSPFQDSGSALLEGLPVPMDASSQSDRARIRIVSWNAFRTMGMEIVEGRSFDSGDSAGTPLVLMVNQALVKRYFAGENPVGMFVRVQGYDFEWEIVGVVADIIPSGLETEPQPEAYFHLSQMWSGTSPLFFFQLGSNPHFLVRTLGEPASAVPLIREILQDIEPLATLSLDVRTMEERLWASVTGPRFYAVALGSFALVALLLASVGLYSILSQAVTDSRREIGIRMALGADRRHVLIGVFRQAGVLAGIGLALGLLTSVATSRFLESLVFGLTPLDPVTFLSVTLLLLGVVAAAVWIPARRATHVDPLLVLRHE